MKKPNDSGQAILEIAFSLSFLLLMIMAVIDFGYMFSTKMTLQNAVRQAGRYAITGQCFTSGDGSCSQSRYQSIVQTLETSSLGFITSSNFSSVVTISCTNLGGNCPNMAGGPGDLITIQVHYPYPFITPLIAPFFPSHAYTIRVSSAFTNQPFDPGQS